MASRRSFRMPLAILALLSAALALVLSAVLMSARASNGESNIFMLQFDTSHMHDPIVNFAKSVMADVGLPEENLGVNFAEQKLVSLYFNDSTVSGFQLVDSYLSSAPAPVNLALWEPSLAFADYSVNMFVQGLNATDGSPVQVTHEMTQSANELVDALTQEGEVWSRSDRAVFHAEAHMQLRIAGTALLAVGFVGMLVVAIMQGYMPRIALGSLAVLLSVAAVCDFVSAGLITHSLNAIQGSYAPYERVQDAVVIYRTSATFLGVTWASAALALVSALLAVAITASPAPPAEHRPRWRGGRRGTQPAAPLLAPPAAPQQMQQPYHRPHTAAQDGHKSISAPYNHSATVDEAAQARGVIQYPPYAIAAEDVGPLRQQHWDHHANNKRYSEVSSLGPSPTRTRF